MNKDLLDSPRLNTTSLSWKRYNLSRVLSNTHQSHHRNRIVCGRTRYRSYWSCRWSIGIYPW